MRYNRDGEGPSRFRGRRANHNRPAFRKGSGENKRSRENQEEQPSNNHQGPRRFRRNTQDERSGAHKFIKKNHHQHGKHGKHVEKDKDELDREMREYWIKSGPHKGKEEGKKDTSLAIQKMNEEMDEYWKARKEPTQDKKAEQA